MPITGRLASGFTSFFTLATVLLGIGLVGCAYQYRTAGQQISGSQFTTLYQCILAGGTNCGATGSSASGATPAVTSATPTQGMMASDPNAIAYYVGDNGARPVSSVIGFDDMSVLASAFTCGNQSVAYVECSGVAHAQVIFVVGNSTDNNGNTVRSYELLVQLTDFQNNVYNGVWESAPNTDTWSNGLFRVEMTPVSGTGQSLVLQTNDFDASQVFNSAIQLQVFDSNGNYAGQISTMTGFD